MKFSGGGVEKFSGGGGELRNFRGGELRIFFFWGGGEIFSVEVTFFRDGLAIFWWAGLRFFRVGLGIIWEAC